MSKKKNWDSLLEVLDIKRSTHWVATDEFRDFIITLNLTTPKRPGEKI